MTSGQSGSDPARKRLGAWYTPPELVELVVSRTVDASVHGRRVHVLDPACGDGRFLEAAARRIAELGGDPVVTGVDVDPRALALTEARLPGAELHDADALAADWGARRFDVVVGNPPFLSQLAAATTRGGASRHGGGPYADAAAEFLALAVRLARPGGRIGLVLPQSILSSRDAGPVRAAVDRAADERWSWWSPRRLFEADVLVCAVGFERRPADDGAARGAWTHVVTDALGVPPRPEVAADGTLGDRAELNLNFRDEYYGLVGAVADGVPGPPLVTSGLIDPARVRWGSRPVRFAKRRFDAPRVDLGRLDARMAAWAARKLVPKVLVASQTKVIEAVADADGAWLPGVPVTSVVPRAGTSVWELAAVLTSPVASVVAWHAAAGTGLSATTLRIGPSVLAALPWPAGDLSVAVDRVRAGDVPACGRAVLAAFGCHDDAATERLVAWWLAGVGAVDGVDGDAHGRDGGGVDGGLSGAADRAPSSAAAPTRATRRSSTAAAGRRAR